MMQQTENKKNRVQKKPLSPKSKGKQITSKKPKKSESSKRKRAQIVELYECYEDEFSVKERAGKLLLSLGADLSDLPGFGKRMLPSNVSYSFWMILPRMFCESYLPKHDATITLVDESGKEFKTNFLRDRHGLSAGWRGFSIGHRLIKGDILLFHLVEPCKFKVHIVRVYSLDLVEAAFSLIKMKAEGKAAASGKGKKPKKAKKDAHMDTKEKKYVEAFPIDACSSQGEPENDVEGVTNFDPCSAAEQYSESSSVGSHSKVLEGHEVTNNAWSNELGGSGRSFYRDHIQEGGISCRSAIRRYDSLSTLAT